MTILSLDDLQNNLNEILRQLREGETFVLYAADEPVAEIKPFASEVDPEPRPFGLCAGQFQVPDDFDDPLPEDVLASFLR